MHAAQSRYLPMLDFTGQAVVSGILQRCQNCTSGAINITSGFPFGSYYHDTVFVSELYNTIGSP